MSGWLNQVKFKRTDDNKHIIIDCNGYKLNYGYQYCNPPQQELYRRSSTVEQMFSEFVIGQQKNHFFTISGE